MKGGMMITVDATTEYMNKKEICELLDISSATLNRMLAAKSIPFHKQQSFTGTRHRVLFVREEIERWLKSRIKPCLN